MNLLPPLPGFSGLHPLVVHFPIALLLVAPLLVAAALVWRDLQRGLFAAALALMVVGTAATWLAVATGEPAAERAEAGGAAIEAVVEQHEELAETTRVVFTLLTVVFAALVLAPSVLARKLDRLPLTAAHAAFLVLYAGGAVFLVNTAHQGGRIVHEFGVRAEMTAAQGAGGLVLPREGADVERHDTRTSSHERPARGAEQDPPARPGIPAGGESAEQGDHVAASSRP